MSTATCDFRFSLQNRYADPSLVDGVDLLGVTNDAVTISGRAMMGEKTISKEEFIAAKGPAIRALLKSFLKKHALPRPNSLVILDMEPEGFAPRALGQFDGAELKQLVRAYALRIHVAGQVLRKDAGVKVGLYQVIVPDGKGELSEQFASSLCGYIAAGRLGMYDELDFICPVLYQRFGPEDAPPARLRAWIEASTQQAIDGSLVLARSDGSPIPLVPVLSFWVFNATKLPAIRQAVAPKRIGRQLELVQNATGIDAVVFWSGWQTTDEMENAPKPVEAIDIVKFLGRTGALPWPGCM
jgi:hypothetical protein